MGRMYIIYIGFFFWETKSQSHFKTPHVWRLVPETYDSNLLHPNLDEFSTLSFLLASIIRLMKHAGLNELEKVSGCSRAKWCWSSEISEYICIYIRKYNTRYNKIAKFMHRSCYMRWPISWRSFSLNKPSWEIQDNPKWTWCCCCSGFD